MRIRFNSFLFFFEENNMNIENLNIPSNIPTGDMPGDKINIVDGHIRKAKIIFPLLMDKIDASRKEHPDKNLVISVCGGSGVGKSGIASVLSYMLNETGIGSLVVSGDNYPKRIPSANDNERLHIFRQAGIRALRDSGILNPDIVHALRDLQKEDLDSDPKLSMKYDWFGQYIVAASGSLKEYLGSPEEQDYDEVNTILKDFRDGSEAVWLKRMGRDEASLWYDKVEVKDKKVLILEWTHGNSEHLKYVDIPILLGSTPEETLNYRLERGRDHGIDSPFTTIVLNLEQAILDSGASRAAIILTKDGEIISLKDYQKLS